MVFTVTISSFFNNSYEIRIFIIFLITSIVLYRLLFKRTYQKYKLPPGPVGVPIFGYLPFLGSKPLKKIQDLSHKYGKVFSLYTGPYLCVFCNDWQSCEEALVKMDLIDRPPDAFGLLPNGLGLSSVNGKAWVDQKRLTVKTMKDIGLGRPQWEVLLQDEINEILKSIRSYKGHLLDIREILSYTFTNNMMTLIFGNRLPIGHPSTVFVSDSVDSVVESLSPLNLFNYMPRLSSMLNKLGLYGSKTTLSRLEELSKTIMKKVEEGLKSSGMEQDSFVKIYHKEVEQQDNKPTTNITNTSLYGNVQVMLFAGTETTRTALIWLCLAMAEHPEKQDKIQKELDSVLGKDGRIVWSERSKVPYTYAAIMESLRWKTIVPISSPRVVNKDIKIGGYDIPKGSLVITNSLSVHNDPIYWSEPHQFKPERFLTHDGTLVNSNIESYMPFYIGRRKCPGMLIALLEIFQYFVALMRNFSVILPEDEMEKYETTLGLTLQVKNVKLRFISRDEVTIS